MRSRSPRRSPSPSPPHPRPAQTRVGPSSCPPPAATRPRARRRSRGARSRRPRTACRPGSTVEIRGGVYHERVVVRVSGAPGAWITFRNYAGEHVRIDGTGSARTTGSPGCRDRQPLLHRRAGPRDRALPRPRRHASCPPACSSPAPPTTSRCAASRCTTSGPPRPTRTASPCTARRATPHPRRDDRRQQRARQPPGLERVGGGQRQRARLVDHAQPHLPQRQHRDRRDRVRGQGPAQRPGARRRDRRQRRDRHRLARQPRLRGGRRQLPLRRRDLRRRRPRPPDRAQHVLRSNIALEIASEHSFGSASNVLARDNLLADSTTIGLAMGGYDTRARPDHQRARGQQHARSTTTRWAPARARSCSSTGSTTRRSSTTWSSPTTRRS